MLKVWRGPKWDKDKFKASTIRKSILCSDPTESQGCFRLERFFFFNWRQRAPSAAEVWLRDCSTRLQAVADRFLLGRRQLMQGTNWAVAPAGERRQDLQVHKSQWLLFCWFHYKLISTTCLASCAPSVKLKADAFIKINVSQLVRWGLNLKM